MQYLPRCWRASTDRRIQAAVLCGRERGEALQPFLTVVQGSSAFSTTSYRAVPLAYTKFEISANTGKKPVIEHPIFILHGLFGSKTNWQTIAKTLSRQLNQTVITVDARNHGDSAQDAEHSYEAMSGDVEELMEKLEIPTAVFIGHSMGGKTAMCLALRQKPNMTDALIVVDSAPATSPGQGYFQKYIAAMKKFEFRKEESLPQTRGRANKELEKEIPDLMVRQFILTNLVQEKDGMKWRVNLAAIEAHIDSIMEFPLFHNSYNGPSFFIAGGKSKYITEQEKPEMKRLFPHNEIATVEGAGHWVHAEKPAEVVDLILQFLSNKNDH